MAVVVVISPKYFKYEGVFAKGKFVRYRFYVSQGPPVQSSPSCEMGCDGTLVLTTWSSTRLPSLCRSGFDSDMKRSATCIVVFGRRTYLSNGACVECGRLWLAGAFRKAQSC